MFLQDFDTTRKDKSVKINKTSVIALQSTGRGYAAASNFFALNLPPTVHQRHWSFYNNKLEQENQLLVKNLTKNACQELLHNHKN